jgi:hypothetical protein
MKKTITLNTLIVSLFIIAAIASYFISKEWPAIVRN